MAATVQASTQWGHLPAAGGNGPPTTEIRGGLSSKEKGRALLITGLVAGVVLLSASAVTAVLWLGGRREPASQPAPVVRGETPSPPPASPPPVVTRPPQDPALPIGVQVSQQAPDLEGVDVDGKQIRLSDYRGRVVVLDVWGDWCPYCRRIYSWKRQVAAKFRPRFFTMIGIDYEQNNNKVHAKSVMQREKLNWPNCWNGPYNGQSLVESWEITGYPTFIILDHRGVVRWRCHPMVAPQWKEVEAVIESLLDERDRQLGVAGK